MKISIEIPDKDIKKITEMVAETLFRSLDEVAAKARAEQEKQLADMMKRGRDGLEIR